MKDDEIKVKLAQGTPSPVDTRPDDPLSEAVPSLARRAAMKSARSEGLILAGIWLIAFSLVLLVVYVAWRERSPAAASQPERVVAQVIDTPIIAAPQAKLPGYTAGLSEQAVFRWVSPHTIIPTRPREDTVEYTVVKGDSVFGIAKKFNIKPETVLWANYDQLNDSPETLSIDMVLKIPPADGVYYQWQEGNTLDAVAGKFDAKVDDIVNFPGNRLDLTNPQVKAGQWILVPGGHREFRTWIVPQIARGKAGVSKQVYGAGACEGSYEGAVGTGGFVWPTASHFLSGNDFYSGHLGIDIAGGTGDSVMASDSGVVVFAGGATGGYGYMIMIDHGNGYQTLYAHLSRVGVGCGQSVYQGQYIGSVGSTGNSTGSHLHFEIRLWGQFINPWQVLP